MTAALLFEQALKLPAKEREELCEKLQDSLGSPDSGLLAEMQRRIQDAMDHPEEGQTLQEWRDEIFATRGLRL